MASSSTSALSDEVTWEGLPEELLRRVLERAMVGSYSLKSWYSWRGAVRRVSRRWRAVHDTACTYLRLRTGVTDQGFHALCGRLPALGCLDLYRVTSLTPEGLRAVGGLTELTNLTITWNVTDAVMRELRGLTKLTTLYLTRSPSLTDAGLRELRGLTALTMLGLYGCSNVTDVGLQHISSLPALTWLKLEGCSTTHAGRNALKAALPALTIIG